jgi:hypothetical protein
MCQRVTDLGTADDPLPIYQAPSVHRLDGVVGGRRGPAPQDLPHGGQRG